MDPRRRVAEAVAIRKNKIAKVGTNQEINQLIDKYTKVISLDGKSVIPGLIDTHIHVADFGRCLLWLDLTAAESIKELQQPTKGEGKRNACWKMGNRSWMES